MYPKTFLYKDGRFREVKIVKKRTDDFISPRQSKIMTRLAMLEITSIIDKIEKEDDKNKQS